MSQIDRLKERIDEFEHAELMPPSWVSLHPHVYHQLQTELQECDITAFNKPAPIMGLDPRIDASRDREYMNVGRD